ncbi:glycerol-3-phosphate 1-O-acyltransferase PlsY [Mycoplasmoides pirum]|uniref:glycerol-3-phosphate 1-O-acyltransferase PlsY n=1 Tax=Mycoplasmoides pirum TaxID=2122 RepID=UPI00047FFDD5|nr:glycerol-3-phosphate 1-O-acyltransferase PlsY [Mycoplasmoides pirum]
MSSELAIFILIFVSIIFGYLIGSIMTSDIIGHIIKNSARLHWSKNPGTTNSIRVYGKKIGIIVGVGDIAKSFIAFLICWSIFEYGLKQFINEDMNKKVFYFVYLSNFFAIIGHCWPIFFKFKGGKAAAPTAGFLISISFWWLLIITIVWVLVLVKTKYVSLASLICASLLPIINLINYIDYLNFFSFGQEFWIEKSANDVNIGGYLTYSNYWHVILFLEINNILIAIIMFWKHRENIVRLINKNENKIGQNKKTNEKKEN